MKSLKLNFNELINMILVKDMIEGIEVTVEIDENADHHKWSGCPTLCTEHFSHLFEAVDVLTVVKAVKNCNTVYEFEKAVQDTWSKGKIAEPIKDELNRGVIRNIRRQALEVLNYSFTDENKSLFDFNMEREDCLDCAFMHYASEYDGLFHILVKEEQIQHLVQSALADC